MLEDKIYLTEEGYKQYCEEVEKIEAEILKNTDYKVQAISEAPEDGWHDNFAYEDACRTEIMLQKRLEQLLKQKGKIELIDSKVSDQNLVNIGDVIKLEFIYDDDDSEVEEVKLTGNWKVSLDDLRQEISLNSPLGRAIYLQKLDSIVSYSVNGKNICVHILDKYL